MFKLREEMTRDLELKGYSPRTIEAYISHVKKFAIYYGKCPSELGKQEIKLYLHYIIKERQLSTSYVNNVYSALKFLYETTLQQEWDRRKIEKRKMKIWGGGRNTLIKVK